MPIKVTSVGKLAAMAICAVAWAGARPAFAEFKICNQSVGVYNVAIGAEADQHFNTEGWWVMPANSCIIPIKEDLDELKLRYVYVYARSVAGDSVFEGNWEMCVGTKRFKIEKIAGEPWNCWVRGFEAVKFLEVDTGEAKSWTLFVRPGKN
jgi:uncharacterized membrane protein